MFFLLVFLICVFIALGVGVLAGMSDIRGMVIPNAYSVYIILAFVVAYGVVALSGNKAVFAPILSHVTSAVLAFGVTFGMFAMRMIGAGDSKLATAVALWVGVQDFVVFIFYMALMGGVLGVCALLLQKYKPFAAPPEGSWVAQVQGGASKVPYGVAIAFGMVIAFLKAGYFGADALSSFLPAAGEV